MSSSPQVLKCYTNVRGNWGVVCLLFERLLLPLFSHCTGIMCMCMCESRVDKVEVGGAEEDAWSTQERIIEIWKHSQAMRQWRVAEVGKQAASCVMSRNRFWPNCSYRDEKECIHLNVLAYLFYPNPISFNIFIYNPETIHRHLSCVIMQCVVLENMADVNL